MDQRPRPRTVVVEGCGDAVDGAEYHCGPMAPQLVNEKCWDWLDDVFHR